MEMESRRRLKVPRARPVELAWHSFQYSNRARITGEEEWWVEPTLP